MSWNLIGHTWAENILKQHLKTGNVHHAYLFTGAPGIGRRSLALEFAQALNCTNPPSPGEACGSCSMCRHIASMQQADLHIVASESDGSMIKVDQIRELQHSLILSPYEAKYRVALLLNFQRANQNAQNALLKTLEEAPCKVILLLTADSSESLLPTISSRCEILRLRPSNIETLAKALEEWEHLSSEKATLFAHLSNGRPGLAMRLVQDPSLLEKRSSWLDELERVFELSIRQRLGYAERLAKEREPLRLIMEVWITFLRDILLVQQGDQEHIVNKDRRQQVESYSAKFSQQVVLEILNQCVQTLELIELNANPRLMLDNLFLQFPAVSDTVS